jgi:HAD superfamily hydrolase (TIGR01509 family)
LLALSPSNLTTNLDAYDLQVTPACVIFDCDGLLVDSESAWTRAEATLYERHGIAFTLEHKQELLGTSGPIAIATLERHLGLEQGDGAALLLELNELALEEVQRDAPALPGAVELVAALREAAVPVGVASNSPHVLVDASLRSARLHDAFAAVVSAQDVAHGKPAPDVYLEACRRLGADPERSIALEDSPTGVEAARAAGMHVIGVPSLQGVELPGADTVASSLRAPAIYAVLGLRLAA